MTTLRLRLAPPEPFDLRLVVWSHGWVDLPPHGWSEDRGQWHTVLRIDGAAIDATVGAGAGALHVRLDSTRALTPGRRHQARAALRHVLRLDDDLIAFWRLCDGDPRLDWAARRGAGRLLRSPTVFEDLLKLLFTTNCSWAATRGMVQRTVEALGEPAPSGRQAFPDAAACAAQDERFWRDVVRAGYRARSCMALSRAAAEGALDDPALLDPTTPTDVARGHLLALPGFGPYAAGQALRLLGHYDDLALDSWCRGKLARMLGRRQPPTDRAIARRYARFGRWAGLALWLDLTADWHGEGTQPAAAGARPW